MGTADAWMVHAVIWGLVYPVLAGIVIAVGWWVYRGFRPRVERNDD